MKKIYNLSESIKQNLSLPFWLTLLLIFFSAKLAQIPWLLTILLLVICFLSIWETVRTKNSITQVAYTASPSWRTRIFRRCFISGKISKSTCAILLFSFVFLCIFSFAFTPLFFSDDALRHLYDGHYLWSGVDVYSIPPQDSYQVLDKLPNHPELPSIYFPVTQIQAMAGSLLSKEHGFRLVYLGACLILLYSILLCTRKREQIFLIPVFCSPWFLITLSSHHADLQAFLILILVGLKLKHFHLLLKKKRKGEMFWIAFLVGLLPGIKPEGIWFLLWIHFYILFIWIKEKNLSFMAWPIGLILSLGLQLLFAIQILFPSAESFFSFLETARFFADWFLAYNPILDLRINFYAPDAYRPHLFASWREEVFSAAGLCFLIVGGFLGGGFFAHPLPFSNATSTSKRQGILLTALMSGLLAMILGRGSWNPWYFSWLFPVLLGVGIFGKTTKKHGYLASHLLMAILVIFYVPVTVMKSGLPWESWGMKSFYCFFTITCLFCLHLIVRYRKISLKCF